MRFAVCRLLMACVVLVVIAAPCVAAPIPSRPAEPAAVDAQAADAQALASFLARDEVARALAAHGLTAAEAQQRLAQLSAEDVATLSTHLDQVQAAGSVPNYIWILLAILMGVTILATVF